MPYAHKSDNVIDILKTVAAPNKLKKVLKSDPPSKRNIYQGREANVRALFDQQHLPRREAEICNRIKSEGDWMR